MFTSIVIPTYNNYSQLADCIESIEAHTRGHQYEIIIMDNGPQPLGYTDPCIRGMHAARGDLICVVNDDSAVTAGWLPPLLTAVEEGHWVFSPTHPNEVNMKALGWFLCFSRQGYMALGGFDPQFKVWCADIDVFKRCELHGKPVFKVEDSHVEHEYSQTTSKPEIQSIIIPWQQEDLIKYQAKWGSDPNRDKII